MISRVFCALLSVSLCGGAVASNSEKEERNPVVRNYSDFDDIFIRNIENDPKSQIIREEIKEEKPVQSLEKKGNLSGYSPPGSPKKLNTQDFLKKTEDFENVMGHVKDFLKKFKPGKRFSPFQKTSNPLIKNLENFTNDLEKLGLEDSYKEIIKREDLALSEVRNFLIDLMIGYDKLIEGQEDKNCVTLPEAFKKWNAPEEIFKVILSFVEFDIRDFLKLRKYDALRPIKILPPKTLVEGVLDLDELYKVATAEGSINNVEYFKKLLSEVEFEGVTGSFGIQSIKIYDKWDNINWDDIYQEKPCSDEEIRVQIKQANDHDTNKLEFFLSVADTFKNVEFLYFQGPFITDEVLGKFIKNCTKLKILILDSVNIKEMTYFDHITTLESLGLGNRWVDSNKKFYPTKPNEELNNKLVKIITNNPDLKELDLGERQHITDEVIDSITTKNRNITYFNLSNGRNLTKRTLNLIQENLKNIVYLDFEILELTKIVGKKEDIAKLIPMLKNINLKSSLTYFKDM